MTISGEKADCKGSIFSNITNKQRPYTTINSSVIFGSIIGSNGVEEKKALCCLFAIFISPDNSYLANIHLSVYLSIYLTIHDLRSVVEIVHFTTAVFLLRKGSLNFGDVRNDAQQKLEAQSPLARSNQVKGNYLLLAVNYEAKLLLCSMWCITTIHFLAMYVCIYVRLVSLMLLFTAALLFSNNHAVSEWCSKTTGDILAFEIIVVKFNTWLNHIWALKKILRSTCLQFACSALANLTKFMRVYQPSAAAPLQSLMPKIAGPAYACYS
ncbi:hypothetical protein Tsp_10136 [Trichinella spiralis]|uniref:hypothetical protein n=1 Tax=Trichinella spiralis TaxID=6334 RepID=UPI0001EFB3A0|nr:hypothetical protein Tsp_10136 [Trichinella spiralis]